MLVLIGPEQLLREQRARLRGRSGFDPSTFRFAAMVYEQERRKWRSLQLRLRFLRKKRSFCTWQRNAGRRSMGRVIAFYATKSRYASAFLKWRNLSRAKLIKSAVERVRILCRALLRSIFERKSKQALKHAFNVLARQPSLLRDVEAFQNIHEEVQVSKAEEKRVTPPSKSVIKEKARTPVLPAPATIDALFQSQLRKRSLFRWKRAVAARTDARRQIQKLQDLYDVQLVDLGWARWRRIDALAKRDELLRKLDGMEAGPCTCAKSYNGLCLKFDMNKVALRCKPVEASREILKLRGRGSRKPMVGLKHLAAAFAEVLKEGGGIEEEEELYDTAAELSCAVFRQAERVVKTNVSDASSEQ